MEIQQWKSCRKTHLIRFAINLQCISTKSRVNPLIPVSDQDRISPYYIYTMQTRDENKEKCQ